MACVHPYGAMIALLSKNYLTIWDPNFKYTLLRSHLEFYIHDQYECLNMGWVSEECVGILFKNPPWKEPDNKYGLLIVFDCLRV